MVERFTRLDGKTSIDRLLLGPRDVLRCILLEILKMENPFFYVIVTIFI